MKKFLPIILVFTLSVIFFSCTGKESEAQTIQNESTECSSSDTKSTGCAGCPSQETCADEEDSGSEVSLQSSEKPSITFVELGSVNCIPCKKMQPVMTAIEGKYGAQIKVIFYDVWKADQKKYAQQYEIRLIPTQVFLDAEGKEIFRHEGFFPEEEIDSFLKEQGLKPITKS